MTRTTKLIVRALAAYCRLRIKYVSDLPAAVPGFLDPSKASHTIVVNANRSKSDHAFTILHEIAHYILHFERSHRTRLPWYLTRKWKSKRMNRLSKTIYRVVSRKLNNEAQADAWAFCVLLCIGANDDAQAISAQCPEKSWLYKLALASSICTALKNRVKTTFGQILHLFRTSFSVSSGKA
jgi:hypothetical protein